MRKVADFLMTLGLAGIIDGCFCSIVLVFLFGDIPGLGWKFYVGTILVSFVLLVVGYLMSLPYRNKPRWWE